jgi:hypothetical protein
MRFGLFLAAISTAAAAGCSADIECSLNGVCTAGSCVCDAPWTGASCGTLSFATTPAGAMDIYNVSDVRNTWSGAIARAPDGTLHAFVPLYKEGSLFRVVELMHGVADVVTGPWDWASFPAIANTAINPALCAFTNASGQFYSLWIGGEVLVTADLTVNFTKVDRFSYPGGNPAPIFFEGAFYMTNQKTQQIYTTPSLSPGGTWTIFANLSQSDVPGPPYHLEDPAMFIDKRKNWHIVNHAYNVSEVTQCGSSAISAHWFSPDGKDWRFSAQPYANTVTYDDGTTHTFATLERPSLHFDASGQLTHIMLAADLVSGDAGCVKDPCVNCKYLDHAGSTVIALGS